MLVDLRLDDQFSNQPIIIFVHGFKGFKDWGHFPWVGDELAKAGFAFVSFNFTHDGTTLDQPTDFADLEAFGNNNYTKELFDLQKVVDAISDGILFSEHGIDRQNILMMGHSRGGGISIITTSEDPRVKGLVTWGSVGKMNRSSADMEQWEKDGVVHIPNARTGQQMPMYYQFVEDYTANEDRFDLQKCCSKISVPCLFIHGTNDTSVPAKDAEDLGKWCASGRAELIENGDHTFGGKHPFSDQELPNDTKSAIAATIKHFRSIL